MSARAITTREERSLTHDRSGFVSGGPWIRTLLLLAGPITAVPLLCFAAAARRLPLTTMGFLQYVSPTLQFLIDHARYPAHRGARRIVSTVRPISGPTGAILRSRPYSPNENASTSEIHGSWPRSIAIQVTPAAAVTTAAFISGVRRSPSRTMPNTTLTSGLM